MEFPLFDHNLYEFAQQLRTEGFDARAEVLNDQVGLAVGPKGLDTNRLRPGEVELFLTLSEINDPANRVVDRRKEISRDR
jgi:hypothetical protein